MRDRIEWHDIKTAPRNRPVWLRIGRWERIAEWDEAERFDPFHFRFDSEQVNFWLYTGRGRGKYFPSHWRELAHATEEDSANLGTPKRSVKPALNDRNAAASTPDGLQCALAFHRQD